MPLKPFDLEDIVAVARSSKGTVTNALGNIVEAAPNTLRVNHNPTTKARIGILVEEQRTNYASDSNDLSKWTATRMILTPNALKSPSGLVDAAKLISTAVADYHILLPKTFATTATGSIHVFSCYAKQGEWGRARIYSSDNTVANASAVYDLTNGTKISGPAGSGIEPAGDGWYRLWMVMTAFKAGSLRCGISPVANDQDNSNTAGDGVSGIYAWGGQLETGSTRTSLITTGAAAVTRVREVVTVKNPAGFIGMAEGTIYAECETDAASTTTRPNVMSMVTDTNNYIDLFYSGGTHMRFLTKKGAAIVTADAVSPGAGYKKVAASYSKTDIAVCVNNGTPVRIAAPTGAPKVNTLYIGCSTLGSSQLNGHITRLRLYAKAMTDAELKAITV